MSTLRHLTQLCSSEFEDMLCLMCFVGSFFFPDGDWWCLYAIRKFSRLNFHKFVKYLCMYICSMYINGPNFYVYYKWRQLSELFIFLLLSFLGASIWPKFHSVESVSVLFEAAASGNPDIISLLLEYGADPNTPTHTGHLPIHRAAYQGHLLWVMDGILYEFS